jgi:hypothetical protein
MRVIFEDLILPDVRRQMALSQVHRSVAIIVQPLLWYQRLDTCRYRYVQRKTTHMALTCYSHALIPAK